MRNCRGYLDAVGCALSTVWRQEGIAVKDIARRLHCSPRTIRRGADLPAHSARRKQTPPQLTKTRLQQIGRRRSAVRRFVLRNGGGGHNNREFPSCASIAREGAHCGVFHASAATVRRDLLSLGFRARKRQRGPANVEGDAARRLRFCRDHCGEGEDIWFSDEKLFDANDHGCLWQWCQADQKPQRRETSRWAPKVHVWGLIGFGVKELVVLPEGAINQHVYKLCCLQRVLIPALQRHEKRPYFMQDGARPHTAHSSIRYLQSKGVKLLDCWPPRSPELNPLENLWSQLQRKVSDRGPRDKDDLKKFVVECWAAIQQHQVDSLVASFGRRCRSVVFSRGAQV